MQPGYFKKLTRFENYIAVFRLVGYSAWNGEAAGSSPACYTRFVSVTVTSQIFDLSPRVTPRTNRKLLDTAQEAHQVLTLEVLVQIQLQ